MVRMWLGAVVLGVMACGCASSPETGADEAEPPVGDAVQMQIEQHRDVDYKRRTLGRGELVR